MLKKPTRHERLAGMAYMVGVASSPQTDIESLDRDVLSLLQTEWRKARAGHEAENVLNNPETRQEIVSQFLQNVEKQLATTFTLKP
jgi:hypothetical protein